MKRLLDGSPAVGIILRCVEQVDVDKLSPRALDGRSALLSVIATLGAINL